MSAEARAHLWGDWPATWSPTTKLCALAVADVVNDMHAYRFFASVEALAHKAGCSHRAAVYAIRQLQLDGWIRLIQERPGRPNIYRWVGRADPAGVPSHPAPTHADPAPHGYADPAPEPKKPKGNLAGARASEAGEVLPAKFPTNRSADRAACSVCADTGWTTRMDNGAEVAVRCTHPVDDRGPVDIDHARRQSLTALRAMREVSQIGPTEDAAS